MVPSEADSGTLEASEYDSDSMTGIVFDGVIGAISGAVGTAAMTVILLVATTLGGFEIESFAMIVDLIGLSAVAPAYAVTIGYLLFLGGGMVT